MADKSSKKTGRQALNECRQILNNARSRQLNTAADKYESLPKAYKKLVADLASVPDKRLDRLTRKQRLKLKRTLIRLQDRTSTALAIVRDATALDEMPL